MSTNVQLPERPSLEQLKKRARELARDEGLKLTEAQLRVARTHGFASWPKLKQHVEMVHSFTREPDTLAAEGFLALACLTYGDDSAARWEQAAAMAAADPALRSRDTWHAAACADPSAIDPSRASVQGGPFDWEPLMYLCYSRVPADASSVLASATLLLDAGADPNVGYLWHGLPSPFTALTGVLGGGESDQPPHPQWQALARLLLERGADPNDAQSLYNRQFRPGTEHLELLLEFGLGRGDGGPWKRRMGAQMPSPHDLLQQQLRWAIHHNMLARVRLFASQGVDLQTPFDDGRTPAAFALICGHTEIADELASHGAVTVNEVDAVDSFIGMVLAGGAALDYVEGARERRPSLVVQAAATGRQTAVGLALHHGWDVNALGRADIPSDEPWQTALHTAVEHDDIAMVRWLLQLGADPSIKDARFGSTALGWAEHFDREEIAALLAGSSS